jgi:hypothetical protein
MSTYVYEQLANTLVGDVSRSDKFTLVKKVFHAVGRTSSGAGAATIIIEGSNDNTNFLELGEIVLTLATSDASDAIVTCSAWRYSRMRITAISGTGANVDFYISQGD